MKGGDKMQKLNPLNDFIFQKLFGEKGDEEQLLSFLNAVLKRTSRDKLTNIEILENKTLTAEIIGDKMSILDIRAVAEESTKVNIEVQLRNLGNMDRRSLFYWSTEYSRGIGAGQDYRLLPNVIAINIVNFEFIPVDDFHTTFHLWEDKHRHMLTDALEIHFVDMVKFKRLLGKDIKNEPLHRWLSFFDKDTSNDVLEEVFNMDMAIQLASEKMNFLSSDKEALRLYQMREMALSDFTSGMNYAREEGLKEGKIEGKIEGEYTKSLEIAKSALIEGSSIDFIAKITGLPEMRIKQLQEEIQH